MFKITNAQAQSFSSPIISKLLNDASRPFPVDAAFQLADIIQQIHAKTKIYYEILKETIISCNGKIDDKGCVSYPDPDDRDKAELELDKLNKVEIELTGELLTKTDDWPKLSLNEAIILKPLIKMNGKR